MSKAVQGEEQGAESVVEPAGPELSKISSPPEVQGKPMADDSPKEGIENPEIFYSEFPLDIYKKDGSLKDKDTYKPAGALFRTMDIDTLKVLIKGYLKDKGTITENEKIIIKRGEREPGGGEKVFDLCKAHMEKNDGKCHLSILIKNEDIEKEVPPPPPEEQLQPPSAPEVPAVPAQAKTDGSPKEDIEEEAPSPATFGKLNPTQPPLELGTEGAKEITTPQSEPAAPPPPPPPGKPRQVRPQQEKYESWLRGNKALFNIFDLLEGQDKIKNFYLNASNLKPGDINKVFIKLYILIYIKFKNNITKESLTDPGDEINAVFLYLDELEVNEEVFLSTEEIKEKILYTTTPRNDHELGKYISYYARLTNGIDDFIDRVFRGASGGGKRRKQKRKSVRRSRKRVSRKRSPKKRTLKKRH